MHAWAVRPLSPTLTIFLPLALQCLGGLESIHQQLVLCVQSLQSQRSVVLETWDLSVSPQVPPYLGPHVMAVVLPGHWFCSADRTRISWSLENWTSTQTSAVKGIVPFCTTGGWIQFFIKGCICFVFSPCLLTLGTTLCPPVILNRPNFNPFYLIIQNIPLSVFICF